MVVDEQFPGTDAVRRTHGLRVSRLGGADRQLTAVERPANRLASRSKVRPVASRRPRTSWGRRVVPCGLTREDPARMALRILGGQRRAAVLVSSARAFEPEELLASFVDLGVHRGRI